MTTPTKFSLLELIRRSDCFPYSRVEAEKQYGPEDAGHAFVITDKHVAFTPAYNSMETRSKVVAELMDTWRKNDRFPALQLYAAYKTERSAVGDSSSTAFVVERSGAVLFGILTFGVHLNLYTKCKETGRIHMWIAQRSSTKPTWPGCLDNAVAGGVAFGDSIHKTAIKECSEEANLCEADARKAQPAGAISYFTVTELGIAPEVQYIYDLELTDDVKLVPNDGEVDHFYLWDMDEVRLNMEADKFKPNCGMVAIDFMLRHGIINETETGYLEMQQRLHRRLVLDDYLM
ncbi:NUDIX hydrolase domain-like protein [Syncephalis fuscata]|nr:NUDIX hydrolase domain-like protein [Syncephalis fuscata]